MNEIFFKVQKQIITCTKRSVIADAQSGWVKMNFDFSDDWKNLDKTVQVTQGDNKSSATSVKNLGCCCGFHGKGHHSGSSGPAGATYNLHLGKTGTWCYLPQELEEGSIKVSVFGYATDTEETVRATTVPCKIYIKKSGFVSDGKVPIPPSKDLYQQIIEELDKKTEGIQDGADGDSAYQIAVKNGFTGTEQEWLESLKGKDGKDGTNGINGQNGRDGATGKDGISPKASVTQTASGATITITDSTGTTTAEIQNGKDGSQGAKGDKGDPGEQGAKGEKGEQGDPGKDGVSPKASVTQTEGGTILTVTDSTGTTTATIKNGEKGDKGDRGEKGDTGEVGATGKDGVSPTASVTQTATGATITVTDAKGTTTATLTNGKDGEKGADGEKGEDGISPTIEVYTNTSTTYQLKITTADGSLITPNLKGESSGTSTPKVTIYDASRYIDHANSIYIYNSYRASQSLDTPETLEGTVENHEKVIDADKNIDINQQDFGWNGLGLIMNMSPETVKSSEMMLQTAKISGTADEKIYFVPPSLVTSTESYQMAKTVVDLLTAETLDSSIVVVSNPLLHTNSNFLTWATSLSSVPDGDYYVVLSAHSDNSKPIYKAIWMQE